MYTSHLPEYTPPFPMYSGHLQTILPGLFRNPKLERPYERERIQTPDDDFLDLDWMRQGRDRLVILSHGLEGDSGRPYMKGMARALANVGFDILAWNFRGCSGTMNRNPILYHSGASYDLETVVNHAAAGYDSIYLIGFSLGGNLTLKFLGEQAPKSIKKAVVFSTPLDLKSGAINLTRKKNWLYEQRFLKSLFQKVRSKHKQFPDMVSLDPIPRIKHVIDFDDLYTGPIHGFSGADDYYTKCSSRYFLNSIQVPTLIVNARNDSFLTPEILDPKLSADNPNLHYLITNQGGHCGFPTKSTTYWSEQVAIEFFRTL